MAYTYNDWNQQSTNALQLTRLELHLSEVTAQMGPDVASDGKSRATGQLMEYIKYLTGERDRLRALVNGTNGGLVRVRLGRA